jgi:potassium efflux system protein
MRLLVTRMLSSLIWLLCLSFSAALAQTEDSARILEWNDNIEQAKLLLEQHDTTIKELELMRRLLANQRDEAQAIIENGSIPLRTLQAKLDALGPVPVEEATESEQIQERRTELQKQISEANEPLIRVEEIIKQSNVLIAELDSNIRQKSTTVLLARGPSPLIVTHWKAAVVELADALRLEKKALQGVFENPFAKAVFKNRLPLSLLLFLLGIATITLVRGLVMRRLSKLYRSAKDGSLTNWPAIAINLAHLALPIMSVGFFLGGFYLLQIDLYGLEESISYLPLVVIFLAIGHWLGNSLFSPSLKDLRIFKSTTAWLFQVIEFCSFLDLLLLY